MKLKWKDIYNDNSKRKFCEVTGIKKEDVEVEANLKKALKERKYFFIILSLLFIALILFTFRKDIKVGFLVLAFFAITGGLYIGFNYFKLRCLKEGLYIKFGLQEGIFKYERINCVYLSRYNERNFILPSKNYNIIIRYTDNYNRIRELSFPNYFLKPEQVKEFIENFEIEDKENEKYVNYQKYKIFKRVVKAVLFVLVFLFIIGAVFIKI